MAPTEFGRVEDESSRDPHIRGRGITALDTYTQLDFDEGGKRLISHIKRHLRWANRDPTALISTSSNMDFVWAEAKRRKLDGKKGVKIHVIDTTKGKEAAEYRSVRGLAYRMRFHIPYRAWDSSNDEYVFLYHIPDGMIVQTIEL